MAIYDNSRADAQITRAEFSVGPHGQIAVYHLAGAAADTSVRAWLNATGQDVIGATALDGHPVLIAQSARSPEQNIQSLVDHGDHFTRRVKPKGVDAWVVRSILGFGGQALQLWSSFKRPNRKLDWDTFVFAAANITANGINLVYRAQNLEDKHQLRFLKGKFNDELAPQLNPGEEPPAPEDKRLPLRPAEQEKKRNVEPVNDFMKRNSVRVGELGLRFIGAFGLAAPAVTVAKDGARVNNWGKLLNGKLPSFNPSWLRRSVGLTSIFGKSMALTSEVEDPYNPKPHSKLDRLREKYSFVVGGLVEAGAFTALAYDSFFQTGPGKTGGMLWRGKVHRDWLGGIGASMFVTGYIVRSWAKFGERKVNMDELYAHVSDTLAKAPPDKIPELLAHTAAEIHTHFAKDKKSPDFSTIYSALVTDLHQQHHIDISHGSSHAHHQVAPAEEPPAIPAHHTPENRIDTPVHSERLVATEKLAATAV